MKRVSLLLVPFFFFTFSLVFAEDAAEPVSEVSEPSYLQAAGVTENPASMMKDDLIAKIDAAYRRWYEKYSQLKTPEQIESYQQDRRQFFFQQLGEMWDKTPLNPQVTETIVKPEYRAEKIVLETLPHFYATGTLFLPLEENFQPPYPAVLVVCGHSTDGKASDLYQGLCILGAMNGLAMYIQDPIDQGERFQHLKADGKPEIVGTSAHNMVGAGSILLGRNTATFEVWDMIRGLDFLQSRPDIIPDRLGVAGNSGGGTQSSYLMALDERVLAAAPSCYLCSLYGAQTHVSNPQDAEQNIFGQLGFGMDHADYIFMHAPKPTLLGTKTGDFFNINDTWAAYRNALRLFSRFGHSERLSIIEIEGEHGYTPEILNATVSWMLRWLAGRDESVAGTYPLPLLTSEEICSTEKGTMNLPEARTTYDLNRDLNAKLAAERRERLTGISKEEFAAIVRSAAVIRTLAEIPVPEVIDVPGVNNAKILSSGERIWLPVQEIAEGKDGTAVRLIVSETGNRSTETASLAEQFSEQGENVWTLEPRGWGETISEGTNYYKKQMFGQDGTIWYLAYLLGETYVGNRAEDILTAARWLNEKTGKPILLTADTSSAALAALHAAAAEPALISGITLNPDTVPENWASYVDRAPAPCPLQNVIHGVLRSYDVEDLLRQR